MILLSLRSLPTTTVLLGIALPLAVFTSVDVVVSDAGVVIRSGLFGWPRMRIDL